MGKKKVIVLATVGDSHCGSFLGLCPAGYVEGDRDDGVKNQEGGRYLPSPAQRWMWGHWITFWEAVERTRREVKGETWGLHMGDSVEGAHHGTTQIISADKHEQEYIRDTSLLPMKRACKRIYVCRGTVAHVGEGGDDSTGKWLRAQRHPDHDGWASHEWRLNIHGVRINARHHAPMGGLPWTRHGSAVRLATQIFAEFAEHAARTGAPNQFPHLVFRAHQHRFADSGGAQLTRVIQVPAWQLATSFVHRISQTTVADIGGIITVIEPDGKYMVEPVLFTPDLSTEVS